MDYHHPSDKLAAAARSMGMNMREISPLRTQELYSTRRAFAPKRNDGAPTIPPPLPPTWPAGALARTLLELGPFGCQFAVGEAIGYDQLFCGEYRGHRRPYCPSCDKRIGHSAAPLLCETVQ